MSTEKDQLEGKQKLVKHRESGGEGEKRGENALFNLETICWHEANVVNH